MWKSKAAKKKERDKLANNERVKLTASYMSGLAVAVIAIGGFNIIFGADFAKMGVLELQLFGARLLVCFVISGVLHVLARQLLLKGLE